MSDELRQDPLRPTTLEGFAGQPAVTRELRIVLDAAKGRGELCDHVLFSGPPGLGKTTLAQIVAGELECSFVPTSGPSIERPGDVAALLTAMADRTCLFIDEIHRMPRAAEEVLYTAMEDRRLDIMVGDGAKARAISVPLRHFVLIGATTQAGLLSAPLRDRFGYTPRLRLYDEVALAGIVRRSGEILGMDFDAEGALAVARRSRGTPRLANRLCRRVRDWAQVNGVGSLGREAVEHAAEAFGVDSVGLDQVGRDLLEALCVQFQGGPVGLNTLAAAVGEAPSTVEEVYEPFLMHLRMLGRTPRGRIATVAAYEHLGLQPQGAALDAALQPTLGLDG
jgi:holliday junction DNA helicase RuvB